MWRRVNTRNLLTEASGTVELDAQKPAAEFEVPEEVESLLGTLMEALTDAVGQDIRTNRCEDNSSDKFEIRILGSDGRHLKQFLT